MDSFVAKNLIGATSIPVKLTRSLEEYSEFLKAKGTRVVFYVNNSQANFSALRFPQVTHVHLNHGESDKTSMVTNQLKAYDFAFVAGEAAINRVQNALSRYDLSRLIPIGRPQLDRPSPTALAAKPSQVIKVLYAPTWEGDSKEMSYSSISSLGVDLVREVLDDSRFSLTVRPHPKTGTWSRETNNDLQTIKQQVKHAIRMNPRAGHCIDSDSDPTDALHQHDVIVADNSAMTFDAIGLNKPILLAVNETLLRQASTVHSIANIVEVLPTILPGRTENICQRLAAFCDAPISEQQTNLRNHIFGSYELGTGTERFIRSAADLLPTEGDSTAS